VKLQGKKSGKTEVTSTHPSAEDQLKRLPKDPPPFMQTANAEPSAQASS
jgi:hypothetical protein